MAGASSRSTGMFRAVVGASVVALLASGCAISRVSVSSTGAEGTKASSKVLAVTDDGRYSLFTSNADNLVPGDTNGQTDVFRHDAKTGETIRADLAKDGGQLASGAYDGAMSSDGRYAAFVTADSLDVSDTNGTTDVYVRDLVGNATTWASRAPGNKALPGGVQQPPGGAGVVISADGRYVSYLWQGPSFPPSTTLFLRDRTAKTTIALTDSSHRAGMLASRDLRHYVYQTTCFQGGCSPQPVVLDTDTTDGWPALPFAGCAFANVEAMSASGRYLVWNSAGGLPSPCLAVGTYLVDRTTGSATRIGRFDEVIGVSHDETSIVFIADGATLPGGTAGRQDLYLRDLVHGTDTRLNVTRDNKEADADVLNGVMSDIGHEVAFVSAADDLVANDHNGVNDVFVRPIGVPAAP